MNLALADIRHNLGRFLMTGVGLGLLMAVALCMVGIYQGVVSSGGDPLVFVHLRDAQELQFKLAPPAARRAVAAGGTAGSTGTVNAVVARLTPAADADSVADTLLRIEPQQALGG